MIVRVADVATGAVLREIDDMLLTLTEWSSDDLVPEGRSIVSVSRSLGLLTIGTVPEEGA